MCAACCTGEARSNMATRVLARGGNHKHNTNPRMRAVSLIRLATARFYDG